MPIHTANCDLDGVISATKAIRDRACRLDLPTNARAQAIDCQLDRTMSVDRGQPIKMAFTKTSSERHPGDQKAVYA